jgi:hypothetical protein
MTQKCPSEAAFSAWVERQRNMGNPWPPESPEELNLWGFASDEAGRIRRVMVLMQILHNAITPIALTELRAAPCHGAAARWLAEKSIAQRRAEITSALQHIDLGVDVLLTPLIRLKNNSPVCTFHYSAAPMPPRPWGILPATVA